MLGLARNKTWENVVNLVHAYDEALKAGVSAEALGFVAASF
jgi:hypothetical protein